MPDLPFDLALRQKQESGLIPPGRFPGYRLTFVGPDPFDFDWVQDADSQILKGVGDPNTVQFAPKGTLYVERDVPMVWINTDGLTAWDQVGGTGTGTGETGFYDTSPAATSLPSGTPEFLTWPTLTDGTDLLDLADTENPLNLNAGTFTFNVTLFNGSAGAADLSYGLVLTDADTSFVRSVLDQSNEGLSSSTLTAQLAAGSSVQVGAVQGSGGSVNVTLLTAVVTRIS